MPKVDIDELKEKIVERLKPLKPNKIILFGSYAYGTPNDESDIDLFLLKDDLPLQKRRSYQREAKKRLMDIILEYALNGIDVLSGPTDYIQKRKDYFYRVEILQNGKVWYERTGS